MDKYAVIQLGGKQLMVKEGQKFEIERQSKLDVDVLLYSDGDTVLLGAPTLKDVTVKAKIIEDKKDKKVVVARYKSKSRYRKNKGHRQPISVVQIESIGDKKAAKATPKTEPKNEKEKVTKKVSKKEETK